MTTGRINQVTIFPWTCPAITRKQAAALLCRKPERPPLSELGVSLLQELYRFGRSEERAFQPWYSLINASNRNTLSPDLTNFENASPSQGETEMATLREHYPQPAKVSQDDSTVEADAQVTSCNRFSYQQVIRDLQTMQNTERYLTRRTRKGKSRFIQPSSNNPKLVRPDRQAYR